MVPLHRVHWPELLTDPASQVVKNPSAETGDKRCEFNPWVGKIPWRRAQQPTAVYLPGESHGQSSLGQSSVWGSTQLDITSSLAHTFTGPAEGQRGGAEQCPRNESRPFYCDLSVTSDAYAVDHT